MRTEKIQYLFIKSNMRMELLVFIFLPSKEYMLLFILYDCINVQIFCLS